MHLVSHYFLLWLWLCLHGKLRLQSIQLKKNKINPVASPLLALLHVDELGKQERGRRGTRGLTFFLLGNRRVL